MPYERQLKEQQVYKTLSICVELIKSDVNLKFRLKVSSNVIYRRHFQGVEYQNCSMCLSTPTSNGLLENLIQFTIKTRNGKGSFKRHIRVPKFGISRYYFLIFSTFSIIANLLAYVRVKKIIL